MDENRFEGTARNFAGKVQETVGNVAGDSKTQAEGIGRQAAGRAQQAYGETMDQVRSVASDIGRGVEQQPMVALMVVGTIGFFLGLMVARR